MKIVVCVKQVDFIYTRTGRNPETHFISEEDRVSLVNPYDELAVEEAIRIKDSLGQGEVILVTLGGLTAMKALKRCLAMGADRLIQLADPSFNCLDAWATSVVLARAIGRLEPGLILCGKEAVDDRGGQVGAYTAELLGLPYISSVVGLQLLPQHKMVKVHRALGKGDKEVVECEIPALLSVEKGLNEPRYPTVPNLLRTLIKKIETWDRASLGLKENDLQPLTKVIEVSYPKPRPKRIALPPSDLNGYKRTLFLLAGTRVEKKGSFLEGPPETMASAIIKFLIENGIVE